VEEGGEPVTVDAPPRVRDFGRSLVWMSIALFVASSLLLVLALVLIPVPGQLWLSRVTGVPGTLAEQVAAYMVLVAPWHFPLLSPLLATRLVGARARRLLWAGSILVVRDDGKTWRLFAHATVVTVAAVGVDIMWSRGALGYEYYPFLLTWILFWGLWFYRVVVITVLWFSHALSLGQSVALLSRAESGYGGPARFVLKADTGHREVVIERVDGARVRLKVIDAARFAAQLAARLAARSEASAAAEVHGVTEAWRAAGPRGAEVVAALLGRS
jgi:hypothetical protein